MRAIHRHSSVACLGHSHAYEHWSSYFGLTEYISISQLQQIVLFFNKLNQYRPNFVVASYAELAVCFVLIPLKLLLFFSGGFAGSRAVFMCVPVCGRVPGVGFICNCNALFHQLADRSLSPSVDLALSPDLASSRFSRAGVKIEAVGFSFYALRFLSMGVSLGLL